MLSLTFALLATSAAATAGTAALVLKSRVRRPRADRLRSLAAELGMTFEPRPAFSSIAEAQRFGLFTHGTDREFRNLMRGEREGMGVAMFDYSFTRGSGGSSARWRHTVVHVHDAALRLPAFALRPESVVHRMGERFFADIDLPDAPEFSRAFLLEGNDEQAVRRAFSAAVREVLAGDPRAWAEGQGADLFVWRGAGLADPDACAGLLDAAIRLAIAFRGGSETRRETEPGN